MTHVKRERTQDEQADLDKFLRSEAQGRTGPQSDMLHRIADMIRPRTQAEIIAAEAWQRASNRLDNR